MPPRDASLALLAAACLQGCSTASPCPPGPAAIPITVTVIDASTGLYVCDAVVTASDGSSKYTVTEQGAKAATFSDASCSYYPDPKRSGTYAISAAAPGLVMTKPAQSVSLTYGTCGDEGAPHSVTIVLSP